MSKVVAYLNIIKLIFIFMSQQRVYADYANLWTENINSTLNNRQILPQSDKGISPDINIEDLMKMTRKKFSDNVVM
jgi:hypothetical protein